MKNKTKRNKIVIGITVALIIVMMLLAFSVSDEIKQLVGNTTDTSESETTDSDDYYTLDDDATAYQEELFSELESALEGDDDVAIATLVVKNYIANFYTWSNKDGSYDVGGAQYIYATNELNFLQSSRANFYNNVSSYLQEYGAENLLEVTNVEAKGYYAQADITTATDKTFDAFYVEASWTYKDSLVFDSSEYQSTGYFNVIKNENGRFEIYKYWGD